MVSDLAAILRRRSETGSGLDLRGYISGGTIGTAPNVEVELAYTELAWSLEIDLLLESAVHLFRANEGCRNNAKET
jgi:hypothetical protein